MTIHAPRHTTLRFEVRLRWGSRSGLSFPEILTAGGILLMVVGLALLTWRAIMPQQHQLDRFNQFHMAAGLLLETMKQDIRSARRLEVESGRLTIERTTGLAANGDLESQTVAFWASGTTLLEERAKKSRTHALLPTEREPGRVALQFVVASAGEDLGAQTGTLWITISALDKAGRDIPRLTASTSLQIKVAELRHAP